MIRSDNDDDVFAVQDETPLSTQLTEDFYEDLNNIQEQYSLYSYEYNKNYKSWGASKKYDLMTNKEYMLCWEWFRDTLKDIEQEDGMILKTLAYYGVANEIFEDHTQAIKYFGNMTLKFDNLVLSFTDLINALTNSSNERSVQLRTHIKNKQHRTKKSKHLKSESFKDDDDKASSLPSLQTSRTITENRRRKSSSTRRRTVTDKSYLPAISSSKEPSTRRPSKVGNHGTEINSIRLTQRRSTISGAVSTAVNDQLDPTLHPVRKLHNMGRMFRRQLSRLTSRDDIKSSEVDGNGAATASTTTTTTSASASKVKKEKKLKTEKKDKKSKAEEKKKKQTERVQAPENEAGSIGKITANEDTIEEKKENSKDEIKKGNVLSSIGRTFRRQLSRLSSFSEA